MAKLTANTPTNRYGKGRHQKQRPSERTRLYHCEFLETSGERFHPRIPELHDAARMMLFARQDSLGVSVLVVNILDILDGYFSVRLDRDMVALRDRLLREPGVGLGAK